ncbi:MAG: NrsF family protein [Arenimonas sp.]
MNDTGRLIEQLASQAKPVKPILSPLRRTAWWALAVSLMVAIATSIWGSRQHAMRTLADPVEAIEWFGSVLTGLCAAYAVFQISVPGRSGSWAWLPVLPLALWLSGIGIGCIEDYATLGLSAFFFQSHGGECARAIVMMSLPMGLVMALMVRHAGVIRPGPTLMLAALSAAALSSAGVSLFHDGETSLMSLLWHGGAVALLSLASLATGGRLFAWIGYAPKRPIC